MVTSSEIWSEEKNIRSLLERVTDPEIPVLSVEDLGIVRDVSVIIPQKKVEVFITPTYSGCPAMDVISINIRLELLKAGYVEVLITKVLSPAWTTDWMSASGKQKLQAYGIAPPGKRKSAHGEELFAQPEAVQCPHCRSYDTQRISEFGSTACKSLYRCNECSEPFDVFKCH